MVCTFFGHRDFPLEKEGELRRLLIHLIEKEGVDTFYVGNSGEFDIAVIKQLKTLSKDYKRIGFWVVLAYFPQREGKGAVWEGCRTVFPETAALAIPKFALLERNQWMLDRADVIVAYVNRSFGGAARFALLGKKRGKRLYNLAESVTFAAE